MKLFSLLAVGAICFAGTTAQAGLFGCHSEPTCAAPCAPTCAAPSYGCDAYMGDTCGNACTPMYTNYCCQPEKKGLCERLFGGMKGMGGKMKGLFSCCDKGNDCCQSYAAPSCCAPVTCAAPCGDVCCESAPVCGDVCAAAPTCAAPMAGSCCESAPIVSDCCPQTYSAPTCAAPCGCN